MRVNGCMAFLITLLGPAGMVAFVIVDALMDWTGGDEE